MNIESLELTNFRSYQHAILSLEEIEIAVMIGENGNGKSSIPYAFTYVLWGNAPDIASMSALVMKKAPKMEVSLVLADDDGTKYKVTRGINVNGVKKKTFKGYLTLAQLNGSEEIDISANGIDETDKKIVDLLGGLTYETAIHSNFNMQGESDKFMRALPSKRRKLFEEILNLTPYETLEKKAKAKVKILKNNLLLLDYSDAKENEIEVDIKINESEVKKYTTDVGALENTSEALLKGISDIEATILGGTADLEAKRSSLYADAAKLKDSYVECEKQVTKHAAVQANKDIIVTNYNSAKSLTNEINALSEIRQKHTALTGEKKTAEEKIKLFNNELLQRKNELKKVNDDLVAEKQKISVKYGLSKDADIVKELESKALDANNNKIIAEKMVTKLQQGIVEMQRQKDVVNAQIATLKVNIDTLLKQQKKIESCGALCPVFDKECEKLSKENIEAEKSAIAATAAEKQAEMATAMQQNKDFENQIAASSKELNQQNKLVTELSSSAIEITNSIANLSKLVSNHKASNSSLVKNISTIEQKITECGSALEGITTKLNELSFDSNSYSEKEKTLNVLKTSDWEAQYQSLLIAEEAIKGLTDKRDDIQHRMDEVTQKIQEVFTQIKTKSAEISTQRENVKSQMGTLSVIKASLEDKKKKMSELNTNLGVLQATLSQIRDRKNKASAHLKDIKNLENIIKVYQTARVMITESSIPKFQQSCNENLDFLGINIRIRIETIEESEDKSKEKKMVPVFSIIVIDGEGDERDYATWSGGEKHRINMAIRQALSTTLQCRSGAKLGLNIIDEGDTKLDEIGKDALVQLVQATNNGQFGQKSKVLFITHSPDLIDRFDRRITISKGKNGSSIKMN